MPERFLRSPLGQSALCHGLAAALLVGWTSLRRPPVVVAELDLAMIPMGRPNAGGGYVKPAPKWTAPAKNAAPAPSAAPAAPEPESDAPGPENGPAGTGGGGDGTSEGDYVPVSQTSRKPRWISNFITSRDYPAAARREGKDGRVVLSVIIDADGRVRSADLVSGSHPALSEVALRKIKEAVFSPAFDASDRPVACKVTLPIRFELR